MFFFTFNVLRSHRGRLLWAQTLKGGPVPSAPDDRVMDNNQAPTWEANGDFRVFCAYGADEVDVLRSLAKALRKLKKSLDSVFVVVQGVTFEYPADSNSVNATMVVEVV